MMMPSSSLKLTELQMKKPLFKPAHQMQPPFAMSAGCRHLLAQPYFLPRLCQSCTAWSSLTVIRLSISPTHGQRSPPTS